MKLRVDFVSDLRRSSVMGYQVTQVRRKPYGKNVMLHFKLERWMDYGPTIAAAFAARQDEVGGGIDNPYTTAMGGVVNGGGYGDLEGGVSNRNTRGGNGGNDSSNSSNGYSTTNDVVALRKIILGCMRNARDAALTASHGAIVRGGIGEPTTAAGAAAGGRDVRGSTNQGGEAHYRGRYNNADGESQSRGGQAAYPGGAESTPRRRIASTSSSEAEAVPSSYSFDQAEAIAVAVGSAPNLGPTALASSTPAAAAVPVGQNGVVDLLG